MMSHAWPIVLRGGLLSPARLPAALRADDRLAPRAALRRAVPARRRARRQASLLGAAARSTRSRSRSSSRSSPPRCSAACCPLRPLLVARYYVLTTASVAAGLWDWLRHGTPAGWDAAGGHAMSAAPRLRRRRRRRRAAASPRRCSRSRSLAIRLESRGGADLPPAPRRPATAASSTCSSCARWSAAPSTWARAWRSTRATRASRASARSCAARRSTSCPTSSTCSRARWRSSARARRVPSQVAQYTERERGRLAVRPGITGWAQVNGRTSLPWARAHRARPLVHRAPLAGAWTCRSSGAARSMVVARRGPLQGRDRRLDAALSRATSARDSSRAAALSIGDVRAASTSARLAALTVDRTAPPARHTPQVRRPQ